MAKKNTQLRNKEIKQEPEKAIVPMEAPKGIIDPTGEVAFGHKAAKALMGIIRLKPKKVIVNGEQYLEFEDWQTVGRFFGYTTGIEMTKEIMRDGALFGYGARAFVKNRDGLVISNAEASCFRDEKKWNTKPEFMLKSMAQTRAMAKALRNILAWVVILAGFKPTPAEEIDGIGESGNGNQPKATEKQIKFIYTLADNLEIDDKELKNKLARSKIKSVQELTIDQASDLISNMKNALKKKPNEGETFGEHLEDVKEDRSPDVPF